MAPSLQFPDCFFLIFGTLAVGGFFCLSIPPFPEIGRGFYKSSAGVFLAAALAMVTGKAYLLLRAPGRVGLASQIEVLVWALFTGIAAVYLYSLWGDPYRFRARAYVATLAGGLAALVVSASRFQLAPLVSLETLLYPLSFMTSAATLGSAVAGMLLGHWYLIDTGMSLVPLQRLLRAFVIALVSQVVVLLISLLGYAVLAAPSTAAALAPLWSDHWPLLVARLSFGPAAALAIAALIARTLAIPQTMAATGLFYIAVLAVAVGEMLSRLILFRTSVPL